MMFFRILLRLVARGLQQLAAHPVSSAVVALLLIALAFVSMANFSEPGPAQATARTSGQPAATVSYFQGQKNFDSGLIWSALSPDLVNQAEQAGASQQDLQDQLNQARDLGRELQGVEYIGGHELQKGGSMQFYVATVRSGDISTDADEIFYVFTLDQNGKIVKIE